jgi:hypothetical protein
MWHAFSKINGGARIRSPSIRRMLHAGISFLLVLPLFCWLGRIWRPFPRSSPSAPLPVSQLPIPAETPRVSATPSLRGFAGEPVPRLLSRTDSRECWPIAIHLRRSFLRYRPSASRFGRGVAEESLTRLRTASRTHEPRQQELARLVLPPPAQSLAAIAQLPGIIGEASRWLLCDGPPRWRSPPLGAGRER